MGSVGLYIQANENYELHNLLVKIPIIVHRIPKLLSSMIRVELISRLASILKTLSESLKSTDQLITEENNAKALDRVVKSVKL